MSGPSSPSAGERPDPGPSLFSLEGRTVPALYLLGWVGTVMGLAVVAVSVLAAGGAAARWIFLGGLIVTALGLVAAGGSQAVENARRVDRAYRGPSPVLAIGAVVAISLLLIILVLAPLAALGVPADSPAGTMVSLLLTTLAFVAVLRLLVVGPGSLSWREMGALVPLPVALRDLAFGAAFTLPVLAVTIGLAAFLGQFLAPAPIPLPPARDAVGAIANLLSAALVAPVGEELFFRGFATTAWARAHGPAAAIVRGAVFFALAHVATILAGNFSEGASRALYSFVALLPVALALGWVFLRRRSVYAPIGLHAAYNAIQVVILLGAASAV